MRQLKIQKSITNRSSEALDKYLVEIGRAPLISIDEEIELAQKIRKGGPEGERAKDKLVTANHCFAINHLVDVIVVVLHTDMNGSGVSKEVVHISKYLLIGSHEEHTEIIRFALAQGVNGQDM